MKLALPLSNYIIMMISWDYRKRAHGQGIGRHSQEDVMAIGQADLKAISDFLGEAFVTIIANTEDIRRILTASHILSSNYCNVARVG